MRRYSEQLEGQARLPRSQGHINATPRASLQSRHLCKTSRLHTSGPDLQLRLVECALMDKMIFTPPFRSQAH